MNLMTVELIADALLYEGYMLYPYRPSSVKNMRRFNFGVLPPPSHVAANPGNERSWMQTDTLIVGGNQDSLVEVRVRFLHLQDRAIEDISGNPVQRLMLEGRLFQPWREAVHCDVPMEDISLAELLARPVRRRFVFPATETRQRIADSNGQVLGSIVRRQRRVVGEIELSADLIENEVCRLRCRVANLTAWAPGYEQDREIALLGSLISAHTILTINGGEFVSLLDPPKDLSSSVAACRNIGTWPVLAGEPGTRKIVLSSPIIVSDYPALAPESPGDLFDGTEIDEILTLRIMTLTDEEKREMAQSDERARLILERTEALGRDGLMRMHGTMRPVGPDGR